MLHLALCVNLYISSKRFHKGKTFNARNPQKNKKKAPTVFYFSRACIETPFFFFILFIFLQLVNRVIVACFNNNIFIGLSRFFVQTLHLTTTFLSFSFFILFWYTYKEISYPLFQDILVCVISTVNWDLLFIFIFILLSFL